MAVLNRNSLAMFNNTLDNFDKETALWSRYMDNIRARLSRDVGKDFIENYDKGQEVSKEINNILAALDSLEKTISRLIRNSRTFYKNSMKLIKKK